MMFSDWAAVPGSGGPFGGPYEGFTAPTKAGETDKVSFTCIIYVHKRVVGKSCHKLGRLQTIQQAHINLRI